MMLPSGLLEVLVELELPPRFAIELSTNEEMIDCADAALVWDVVPDVAPEALEVLAVRALIRFWNAVLKLEATLLEAPEPPPMLPSNSLFVEATARLVSAAAVEAAVGVEALAAELKAPLSGLLPMLPIDIIIPNATPGIRAIGRPRKNLRGISLAVRSIRLTIDQRAGAPRGASEARYPSAASRVTK
jgi:hypothetical protein